MVWRLAGGEKERRDEIEEWVCNLGLLCYCCGDIIVWAAVGISDVIVAKGVTGTEFYHFMAIHPILFFICCSPFAAYCGDRLFAHNP